MADENSNLENARPARRGKAVFVLVPVALFLFMALAHAGGLGIPVLVTIIGLAGYLLSGRPSLRGVPAWFLTLAIFTGWAVISSLWSSFEDLNLLSNPIKLLIGCAVYPGALLLFRSAGAGDANLFQHFFIAVLVLALGVLFIDILTGYGISFMIDPMRPGQEFVRRAAIFEMNLGHAIVIIALLMPLGMVLVYQQFSRGWLLASLLAMFVFIGAMLGQLAVGMMAVLAGLAAMGIAIFAPRFALRSLIWIAIASIILAPFWTYPLEFVSPEFKASLPFSWEHRLEMWAYTSRKIFEAPIWGHGFDAVRTFDGTFSSRGIDSWAIVSLHPHNAGLHIWAETGVIGAVLASAALYAIGTAAERFCRYSQPRAIAIAGFIAVALVVGNITYGVWQEWWWATLFFISGAFYLLPANSQTPQI